MTNETAPERIVNTQTEEAQRVQGSVMASAAHLSTQRFQGWGNPIVASCKNAADMIGALASERDTIQSRLEAAQARIAELEDALKTQIFFHAMTLTLRREHMDPEEIKDVEFRRDDARAALEGKGYPANQDSHGTDQQHESPTAP